MSIIVSGRTSAAYGNPHRRQTLAGATLYFYAASADDEGQATVWSTLTKSLPCRWSVNR